MAPFLYAYIIAPFATIRDKAGYIPLYEAAIAIFCLSFAQSVELSGAVWLIASKVVIGGIGVTALVMSQSLIIDFIAQWMGYAAQSRLLFLWLSLTYLPFLLLTPLQNLITALGVAYINLVLVGLVSFVTLLQIQTLRVRYELSLKQAILLYVLPIIGFLGIIIGIAVMFGSAILASF